MQFTDNILLKSMAVLFIKIFIQYKSLYNQLMLSMRNGGFTYYQFGVKCYNVQKARGQDHVVKLKQDPHT